MDCENCGRTNEPGARYCARCGFEFQQDSRDEGESGREAGACSNCGAVNAPGAAYCAACGVGLGTASAAPAGAGPMGTDRRLYMGASAAPAGGGSIPPRGLGEFLEETFRVYRAKFLPFIGIAAIPQVAFLLSSVFSSTSSSATQLFAFLLVIAGLVLSVIAVGATVFGVARHYTRGVVDVVECFSHALQVGMLLIAQAIVFTIAVAASFVVGGAMIGVGAYALISDGGGAVTALGGVLLIIIGGVLLLAGIVIGVFLAVYWFCGAHAVVLEGVGPIAGLRRSWNLVRDSWWRVFGIGLIFVIIATFAGIVISIPIGLIGGIAVAVGGGGAAVGLAGAVSSTLVAPFGYIGATLIYFDLRVRKEGYDLDALAGEISRV